MLNKLKCIDECINYLKETADNLPIDDPSTQGYLQAIDDLKGLLIDEQDFMEQQYNEHYADRYAESKYSF